VGSFPGQLPKIGRPPNPGKARSFTSLASTSVGVGAASTKLPARLSRMANLASWVNDTKCGKSQVVVSKIRNYLKGKITSVREHNYEL